MAKNFIKLVFIQYTIDLEFKPDSSPIKLYLLTQRFRKVNKLKDSISSTLPLIYLNDYFSHKNLTKILLRYE